MCLKPFQFAELYEEVRMSRCTCLNCLVKLQDARESSPGALELSGKGSQLWDIPESRAPASPTILADAAAHRQTV